MKRVLGLASLTVAVVASAVVVSAASATSSVSTKFTATYAGKVTEAVNGNAVTATPKGTGKATLIGTSTLTGTITASTANPPCTPLAGPGTIKGKTSSIKLTALTGSKACVAGQDDQNNVSFGGTVKIAGGTGSLKKAKGTLVYSGHYDRGTGAFTVKFTGSVIH
jgi:hypothetical protein